MIPKDTRGLEEMIFRKAEDAGINPAIIAHDHGLPVGNKRFWWHPHYEDDTEDVYVDNIDLLAGASDPLSIFVDSLARSIQFPRSTAFLHGLGVVSAAMVERFYYSFNGSDEHTVALYTVGAQPPSTGKSAIDSYLTAPAYKAYQEKRDECDAARAAIGAKLAKVKAELKKAKTDSEFESLAREAQELQKELIESPAYVWAVNDPTPEGCEKVVASNNGFFNVVSDESSAVKVILGCVYGDGASNNGVFLKAWDNGYLAVARSTRDGYVGRIRGSMAVLAQDASVSTILKAGLEGEGVSERFLIIRERNMLGRRDHTQYTPVSREAKSEYEAMLSNICHQGEPVVLRLSPEAEQLVRSVKQEQEPMMADGGKYSSPILRGVVGKNEKQIIKIACVLHAVEQWSRYGGRSCEIGIEPVLRAVSIFQQLLKTYVAAADSKGFTGFRTEIEALIEALVRYAGKGKMTVDLRTLRDNIKNRQAFAGIERLTDKLRGDYMPALERSAHVVFDKTRDRVYINPRLAD